MRSVGRGVKAVLVVGVLGPWLLPAGAQQQAPDVQAIYERRLNLHRPDRQAASAGIARGTPQTERPRPVCGTMLGEGGLVVPTADETQ
jgi:hypothetical protein